MTPEQHWNRALDEMKNDLDAVRRSLDEGDVMHFATLAPPKGLPALPPGCVDQAQHVAELQRQVEDEVRRHLDEHVAALPLAPQRQTIARQTRFDAHA